ncbi:hypothetical protein LTS10_010052 [Elasticomyces elasticus]|nr:hypothetical protein LTS10_010052 [Elasticomyces elasticus]
MLIYLLCLDYYRVLPPEEVTQTTNHAHFLHVHFLQIQNSARLTGQDTRGSSIRCIRCSYMANRPEGRYAGCLRALHSDHEDEAVRAKYQQILNVNIDAILPLRAPIPRRQIKDTVTRHRLAVNEYPAASQMKEKSQAIQSTVWSPTRWTTRLDAAKDALIDERERIWGKPICGTREIPIA